MTENPFEGLPRQKFRRYFQPSRIVLGVLPSLSPSGVNIVTLCFNMYCSYRPPMMAISIQRINASYEMIVRAEEWVLSVPGPSLVRETVFCGTHSATKVDKVSELGLELCPSECIQVPGIRRAIANIELRRVALVETGDHVVAIGRVLKFGVRPACTELPLLSVGPDTRGYRVLARHGMHRIAIVDSPDSCSGVTDE